MKKFFMFLYLIFFLFGCMPQPAGRLGLDLGTSDLPVDTRQDSSSNINGSGVVNNNGNQDGEVEQSVTDELFVNGRSELRHLIDPFDGTYKIKTTIPKNFSGFLYISGLNIQSLSSKILNVRFRFGRDLEPIEISGVTVGRGEGITPTTDIEVLIDHLKKLDCCTTFMIIIVMVPGRPRLMILKMIDYIVADFASNMIQRL